MQYYPVDIPSDQASIALLQSVAADPTQMWATTRASCRSTLHSTFHIDTMSLPWPPWPTYPTEPMTPASLYNPEVLLRIVPRGAQWIALRADKRDDDMLPYDNVPKTITLQRRAHDGTSLPGSVTVTLQPAVRLSAPPAVGTAWFWWESATVAGVGFNSPLVGTGGVWRVRMAAFDASGNVVQLPGRYDRCRFQLLPTTQVHSSRHGRRLQPRPHSSAPTRTPTLR